MAFDTLQELEDRVLTMVQNERAGTGLDLSVAVSEGCTSAIKALSRLLPRHVSDTLTGDELSEMWSSCRITAHRHHPVSAR